MNPSPWRRALAQEARDLAAALAGGAIVGVPLLFTMEMWERGADLSPLHLLGALAVVVLLNWGFDLMSGFREKFSPLSALSEAVTGVAIGTVFSVFVLGLIGELGSHSSPRETAGKVLLTALSVAVGAAFANSQVRKQSRNDDDSKGGHDEEPASNEEREAAQWKADLKDIGATVAGSVVFALNVAPTEEVVLIASRLSPAQLAALLLFEIVLGYVIVFASGFTGPAKGDLTGTLAQKPWAETLLATSTSLAVAGAMIALVGQRAALDSPTLFIAATLTLGLPAVVGGAAGRIIA